MTTKKPALVTFLLDRSQSMLAIKKSTIDAFNAYLATLQEEKDDGFECDFTFLQFDSISLDKVYVAQPVRGVKKLDNTTFQPRGSTPLIDACIKTINAVALSLAVRDDKPKVVVCFQTDGEENCSTTPDGWNVLNALIKEKTLSGWEFIFMGAGIDSYVQSQKMGIASINTVSYDSACQEATMDSYVAAASNTRSFTSGQSLNASFTASQKMKAGDKFDPARASLNPGAGSLMGANAPGPLDLSKKSDAVGKAIQSQSIVDDFDLNAKA